MPGPGVGQEAADPAPARRAAKVSARASVKPEYLVCMIDGSKHKILKRHLQNEHGMSRAQYPEESG